MEKKTVIANIRAEITLNSELQNFFAKFDSYENAWFARQGGDVFLGEFGHTWDVNFIDVAQSVFDAYFQSLGVRQDQLIKVELTDSRKGSWIMEAALTLFGTVGTVYTILKGIAELPELADGLENTKARLQKELSARFKKEVSERIEPVISNAGIPALIPPGIQMNPVSVSCSIDARPLRGLTPDVAKTHAIYLAVAVSRSALSVENLGDSCIENLRIGIFKSSIERNSWNFGEAYSKSVLRLSGKQSTSLSIDQFVREASREELNLWDDEPLYVDCWLQDNAGIYLFNFFLE